MMTLFIMQFLQHSTTFSVLYILSLAPGWRSHCMAIPQYASNRFTIFRLYKMHKLTSFSICETIFAYVNTFLSQTDHCSRRFLSAVFGRRLPIHLQYAGPVVVDSPVTMSKNLVFWYVMNVSLCNLHLY